MFVRSLCEFSKIKKNNIVYEVDGVYTMAMHDIELKIKNLLKITDGQCVYRE